MRAKPLFSPTPRLEQLGQHGDQVGALGDQADGGRADLNAVGDRFEALLQGFDESRVGDAEGAGEQLGGDGRVGLQGQQVAVADDLRLGEVPLARHGGLADLPVAGHLVEELLVERRQQDVVQLLADLGQLHAQALDLVGESERRRHLDLDLGDVRLQLPGA